MSEQTASLDHELIRRLAGAVPLPLVLHGSSGVPRSQLRAAVADGIRKVNVGTALNVAFTDAVRGILSNEPDLVDPRRYRKAMGSIQLPVLLVHGDRDRLVPVAAARDISRRHPAWRYLELAGVGHVPQLQKPDELAAAMVDWLAEGQKTRSTR